MITVRSGIGIPINLNGRPYKRMAIFERSNYSGNFFHLNERGEFLLALLLHRRPQVPNPTLPNLARGGSTVASWLLPLYWLYQDLLSSFR